MSTERIIGGATGALSGAAAGAKLGSIAGLPGVAVGAVVSGLAGIFGAKKAPKPQTVDIAKLVADARQNATENLANSLKMEAQYLPGQAAFRSTATDALARRAAEVSAQDYVGNLLRGAGGATQFLAEGSIARQILDDAKLGGSLPADVQAQVTKAALEGAGQAGIAGSTAARGVVARDIGMSSEALRQRRLAQALGIESSLFNAYLQGEGARGTEIARSGQLALATPLPESGLSSGDLASLAVANTNIVNQGNASAAAARNAQLQGLFGTALGFAKSMPGKQPAVNLQIPQSGIPGLDYIPG